MATAKMVLGMIPGSMGDPGYVVRGRGNASALNSAAHGAGREEALAMFKKALDAGYGNREWAARDATRRPRATSVLRGVTILSYRRVLRHMRASGSTDWASINMATWIKKGV